MGAASRRPRRNASIVEESMAHALTPAHLSRARTVRGVQPGRTEWHDDRRHRTRTSRRTPPRTHLLPRLDRRLGGALLASEGLHARLHDGARRDRADQPEFERRDVKIIGLSVDPTGAHEDWVRDIEETQGQTPNYPIIGDADFAISKAYGMLGAPLSWAIPPTGRRPTTRPAPTRFVIGPDKKIKAVPRPDDDGAELRRGAPRHRLAPADRRPQGLDACQLEAGRRRDPPPPARSRTTRRARSA